MVYQLANSELAALGARPMARPAGSWESLGGARALRRLSRHSYRSQLAAVEVDRAYLGYMGITAGQGVGAAAPIAGAVTTGVLASTSIGAFAGPIGAAVGAVVGIIGGLLAAHAVRAKQAKNENQAMNLGVQSFDSDLKKINAALKSGQIDSAGASQAVQVAMQGYWTIVANQIQPGRNGCNGGTSCPPAPGGGKNPCTGNIGAACCVGCYDLALSMTNPDGVLAAIAGQSTAAGGRYVSNITQVYGSKYGGQARGAYSLDWTPPAATAAVSGLGSSIGLGSGSSSGLFWLLLAGGVAYAISRA